jgi:glutamate synthase domain-containing protein 2/rubredoxin
MCGQLYDEAAEGVQFAELPETWVCPVCGAPKSLFEPIEEPLAEPTPTHAAPTMVSIDSDMALIQQMALTRDSIYEPAGTRQNISDWNQILLMGAQLARKPLEKSVDVNTRVVIGKHALKPMEIETPIMVSHMSFGALSRQHKLAIAKASAKVGTAVGGGEGGVLSPEMKQAHRYIFEYVPNRYSVTNQNLAAADAIEIKIGQSAKPGMGGHLPAEKVNAQIASTRGVKVGQAVDSPASFANINEVWDLMVVINELRERSGGRPVGVKLAANNIENDLKWIQQAKPDFITIDGRGGGTGSAPVILKDSAGIPTIYALYRAKKFLRENDLDIDLIVTGGLRTPADVVRALAMGADAVALATAVLMALAAPGDLPDDVKVTNFLAVATEEVRMLARAMGHSDIANLGLTDLATTSHDIATYTDIRHV